MLLGLSLVEFIFGFVFIIGICLGAPVFVGVNIGKNYDDINKGITWGVLTFLLFFTIIFLI